MLNYVKALAGMKLGQKGAMFVEYALILAFVVVIGVAFLSDGAIATNIKSIFSDASTLTGSAAANATSALTSPAAE